MHDLRVPTAEDAAGFFRPVWRAFGEPAPSEEMIDDEVALWEPERSLGVVEGGEWVGVTGAYTFELTVPGGAAVPAAGVTMVGVNPTHRRRGILRALMTRQLDDIADGGEPLAMLTASESSIYGRFGYGLAASAVEVKLETDPRRRAFVRSPRAEGSVRLVTFDDGYEGVAAAYERCRALRPGALSRSEAWWDFQRRDRPRWRHGASGLFMAVHDGPSGPDGYVLWRIRERWSHGLPEWTAAVRELVGVDAEVEAALWDLVLGIDLVHEVTAFPRPVDEPLRWRLAEPRRLRTTQVGDWLWVRVLDVPSALTRRTWFHQGSLVLDVRDELRPATGGVYRLEADGDGRGTVERLDSGAPADLVLGVADLGALYLGGVAPSTLARAGRLVECDDGAAARADRFFRGGLEPFCATMF